MRVKNGCHFSSSFFSFKGDANQSDTFKINDTKISSCPEKPSAYSNQIACYDVHIFMKIVSVILRYIKFY